MPVIYVLWSIRGRGPSSIAVPNFKRIGHFVQKLLRGRKYRNWVTRPRPRPRRGRFMIRMQGGSVLYVTTKFQVDCCFRSKVIRGSHKFEIGSRDPKPRHHNYVT